MKTDQVIANAQALCDQLKNLGVSVATFGLDSKHKRVKFRFIQMKRTSGLGLTLLRTDQDIDIKDLDRPMQQEDLEQWLMKIRLEMA